MKEAVNTDMRVRLDNLYDDLKIAGDDNGMVINAALEFFKGREEAVMEMYARERSPLKVIDYDDEIHGECDMSEIMIEYSEGYGPFVDDINHRAGILLSRYSEAIEMLFLILALPAPYSSLIYLRYYRRMRVNDIIEKLHLSRSSYYRLMDQAVRHLNNEFKESNVRKVRY